MTRPRLCRLEHLVTVAAGLAVFAAIFIYTGEGEIMAAAFGGAGTALLIRLGRWLGTKPG